MVRTCTHPSRDHVDYLSIAGAWGDGHGADVIPTVLGIGVGLFAVTTAAVLITSWLSSVVAKALFGAPTNGDS